MDLREALQLTLSDCGISQLKEKQEEAVLTFLSGKDTFVSLPTGYGKSVIFAILPLLFDRILGTTGSIVVCVSPLTALMMDQKLKLVQMGLSTEFVAEQSSEEAIRTVLNGEVQLVYISPERIIGNARFREMFLTPIYKKKVVAFVVDEAHCVKTWGDEFRVSFALLGELRSMLSDTVKVLATTATATMETLKAVKERLAMHEPAIVSLPPDKRNIRYTVMGKPEFKKELHNLMAELSEKRLTFPKTLVFCQTYMDCAAMYQSVRDSMAAQFTEPPGYPIFIHGFRMVDMYHRAMPVDLKEKVLHSFITVGGKLLLLFATSAFGLGIDCPDIRRVYHWGPPNDLESYVQESGRAGRDGQQSEAILLYGKLKEHTSEKMHVYAATAQCRRVTLFKDFLLGEQVQSIAPGCKCCDMCTTSCQCILCRD